MGCCLFALQAFDRINGYLNHIKSSSNLTLVTGGNADKRYNIKIT